MLHCVLCAVRLHQIGMMICLFVCMRTGVPAPRLLIFQQRIPFPAQQWSMPARADLELQTVNSPSSGPGPGILRSQAFPALLTRPPLPSESCGAGCRISVPFGYLCTLDNNHCQANASQCFNYRFKCPQELCSYVNSTV